MLLLTPVVIFQCFCLHALNGFVFLHYYGNMSLLLNLFEENILLFSFINPQLILTSSRFLFMKILS